MKKQPFFSIPIGTYNRAVEVEFAVKRLLAQSFKDFEIIISDDNSTDETEKLIKKFKDPRVKYYKNKKNLGAIYNIGKAMAYSKGKHVFLHGDDDYLLYDDVLADAYRLIKDKKYGLVRFNYLYQSADKRSVFDYMRYKSYFSKVIIKRNQIPEKIIDFMEKADLYFITGIVFENLSPNEMKIIDSELMPWFSQCYKSILKNGGYYDSQYRVVASWSLQNKNPVFFVRNGQLPFENLYNVIRDISGEEYYRKVLGKQIETSVSFLGSIKYNSNRDNLVKYARRIIVLEPKYRRSIRFWSFLIISYLTPDFVLAVVKFVYIKLTANKGKPRSFTKIINRVNEVRGF